ncbi:LuxR family transcriptional regulator [Streptomyces sp. AS02]|uniref:helix-turn-helix transcriptional regulator n=1 Tax=Streptomyces sp. AS02 TaxID=2938946 RepID=UPI00202130F3|nr:LuxR family transcriptional regulator [Streptomyces sp. AS02]MCL8017544.1 LuxR C-terminal-related transcriptional regulator [Streptomyces sp. AS02]
MSNSLDIGDDAARVYRAMLAHPSMDFQTLRKCTGLQEEALREQLDRLSELSLVRPSTSEPGVLHAVGPQVATKLILARQEARLAAEQKRTADIRLAMEELSEEFQQGFSTGVDGIDAAHGIDEIRDRIRLLCSEAREEVMAMAPGAQSAENMESAKPQDAELLARGVRMRTLYQDSLRNDRPTVSYAAWLTSSGGQVRTAPTLPIRLLIFDRATAIIPMDAHGGGTRALFVRSSGVLLALCELFEAAWVGATPLEGGSHKERERERDHDCLVSPEPEYLRLLAQGHTDETIAKRLGVSPRTARRIAAQLMEKLGARSRFQAGVEAALRGWVQTVDP